MQADHHLADPPGHGDHAAAPSVLGPIDVMAWGAGILGVAIGLAIAWCFVLATGGFG